MVVFVLVILIVMRPVMIIVVVVMIVVIVVVVVHVMHLQPPCQKQQRHGGQHQPEPGMRQPQHEAKLPGRFGMHLARC